MKKTPNLCYALLAAFFFALILSGLIPQAHGESWSPDEIPKPEIPNQKFSVADYGAIGDGTTNNAEAIQRAINEAEKNGGGMVIIPTGTFMSGPIALRSRIDLHLEKGAVLLMSRNWDDFPVKNLGASPEAFRIMYSEEHQTTKPKQASGYQTQRESMNGKGRKSFITASDCVDVQISGEGMIDGQGDAWWEEARRAKAEKNSDFHRPQMINLNGCERVRLIGFTTKNPPNLHCGMGGCSDVIVESLTMDAPDESPHTDALNLKVKRALIQNCYISTGDDNIVFVGSSPPRGWDVVAEDVVIRDCKFGYGHGLSIGSYTTGGIRNILVENVSFEGTTSGIRFKSARGRGGVVENLVYKNVTMRNVRWPISIGSYYPKLPMQPDEEIGDPSEDRRPVWRNIVIENVTATDVQDSITLWGLPDEPITDVVLKNINIESENGAKLFNCRNVELTDVKITPQKGDPLVTFNAEISGMEGREWNESDASKK